MNKFRAELSFFTSQDGLPRFSQRWKEFCYSNRLIARSLSPETGPSIHRLLADVDHEAWNLGQLNAFRDETARKIRNSSFPLTGVRTAIPYNKRIYMDLSPIYFEGYTQHLAANHEQERLTEYCRQVGLALWCDELNILKGGFRIWWIGRRFYVDSANNAEVQFVEALGRLVGLMRVRLAPKLLCVVQDTCETLDIDWMMPPP